MKKYVGKFEVEKGFTIKTHAKLPSLEIGFLDEGESFFVPESELGKPSVMSAISYARKKFPGRVFACRDAEKNGEKGTRVFRIK